MSGITAIIKHTIDSLDVSLYPYGPFGEPEKEMSSVALLKEHVSANDDHRFLVSLNQRKNKKDNEQLIIQENERARIEIDYQKNLSILREKLPSIEEIIEEGCKKDKLDYCGPQQKEVEHLFALRQLRNQADILVQGLKQAIIERENMLQTCIQDFRRNLIPIQIPTLCRELAMANLTLQEKGKETIELEYQKLLGSLREKVNMNGVSMNDHIAAWADAQYNGLFSKEFACLAAMHQLRNKAKAQIEQQKRDIADLDLIIYKLTSLPGFAREHNSTSSSDEKKSAQN